MKVIKAIRKIMLILSLALILSCAAILILSRNTLYTAHPWEGTGDFEVSVDPADGIIELEDIRYDDGYVFINVKAENAGKAYVEIMSSVKSERLLYDVFDLKVTKSGIIYESISGNFSGSRYLVIACCIYYFLMTLLCIMSFCLRMKHDFFSYKTPFYCGISLFLLTLMLPVIYDILRCIINPGSYSFMNMLSMFGASARRFVFLAVPVTMIFSAYMAVSNIVLIKKEGGGIPNVLAVSIGIFLMIGSAANILISWDNFAGSIEELRRRQTITSVFSTAFVYFELILVGVIFCGIKAARRKPAPDFDHLIILGCQVGDDGSPLPLLRGRIDRALEYADYRHSETGKSVTFVCSGGQGPNEVISEAECMKRYLISKEVDENDIILEDKSTSTFENMKFSKEKISDDAKVLFSTSDYHVLRSGIIASRAGVKPAGIGAKTKWYFWANAFMREFIGLSVNTRKRHVLNVLVMTAILAACNYFLYY
ncbi:MAG: YdcF family protein [Ruminococcus sp.]|nr:YdcF family protein [Ruminococcus sp.]